MTHLKGHTTLLRWKIHKHDLTICSAWHFGIRLICNVVFM